MKRIRKRKSIQVYAVAYEDLEAPRHSSGKRLSTFLEELAKTFDGFRPVGTVSR
jgi:hypothetical protein